MKTSRIGKFYEKSLEERINTVREFAGLGKEEINLLKKEGALPLDSADKMIENVVGTVQFPLGIATNFYINGKPYLIPMAIEEPSVVAAASHAAKLTEGFETSSSEPIMVGQIQLLNVTDLGKAVAEIEREKAGLIEKANNIDSTLIKLGGGVKDLQAREIESSSGKMLIVELFVDVRDAMGANAVNRFCEKIAPAIEEITGGNVLLRIVSNLCTKRIAKAKAVWKNEVVGEEVIEGVLHAYAFAEADQYRCTTHNKGTMNGVDAVAVATGQDFRAVEAAAHSYSSLDGSYRSLTKYYKDRKGNLIGEIEIPVAVGIVGGAVKTNPVAQLSLKILGVKSAQELAEVMAAVGLANNFAALRALVTEGIQKGHMRLHKRKFREERK